MDRGYPGAVAMTLAVPPCAMLGRTEVQMPVVRNLVALVAMTLCMSIAGPANAQHPADWTEPVAPFRIADNLYYVGSKGLASYLIATPKGHILINSNLESSVPLLKDSIAKLGFKIADVKILLISHAHGTTTRGVRRSRS
jgi:hypothetical protein